jgi:16S rRNA processing protein RimM
LSAPPGRKPLPAKQAAKRPKELKSAGRLIVMGRIAAPFGVRGWVKVQLFAPEGHGLLEQPVWFLRQREAQGEFNAVTVIEAAQHGKVLIAQLEGLGDRDAAAAATGTEIAMPRSALPARETDEYYWSELIGLPVVNREHEALGTVSGLLETGVHDVLVVKDGKTERLLPMVAAVIDEVDLDAAEIRVDWGRDW